MPSQRAVHVGVRVRPAPPGKQAHWRVDGNSITEIGHKPRSKSSSASLSTSSFAFEHVFDETSSNVQIFDAMCLDMLEEATLQGYNATCFAYGQTASGKTHTMMGPRDEPGTILSALDMIFRQQAASSTHEFLVRVSYMEIYKEVLSDLLADHRGE